MSVTKRRGGGKKLSSSTGDEALSSLSPDFNSSLGVIKAVKDLINAKKGGDVTALWVTHRLEELEYADGVVYMENERVVRHCDAATILDFIKLKQSSYLDQISINII